ncbi:MAG: TraB/GumN family protein [Bacteroidota bacterium]
MSKALMALLCLMIGLFNYSTKAQQQNIASATTQSTAATAAKSSSTLLWKIEGNGIQPSYLYGTFHLLPQKDFLLKENVKKAFKAADQIVMELDMDDPNMQAEMMQSMMMKDGQTLDKLLSEENYKALDKQVTAKLGSSLQMMNNWKPFFIGSMLIIQYIEGPPASFEQTFTQMAMEQKKEILGLETVGEQMAIFDIIPYQEQIEDVKEMLDDNFNIDKIFQDMINMYKAENVEGLYQYVADYMDTELEKEELLNKRNRNWIPRIGEMAKEKSTFFGVGAGHLGGEQGLLVLLRKAGYTLSPVQ